MTTECPECGENFRQIGKHWAQSSCNYPKLTEYQIEVVNGLLMGDGYVNNSSENRNLRCNMTNEKYLKYLDNEVFPTLGLGVVLSKTAKQSANYAEESGFKQFAKSENYSDVYRWQTRNLPCFEKFKKWYSSGEKVWPNDIKLTATTLKHWYCGDGCLSYNGDSYRISIAISNERDNTEKVNNLFVQSNLPKPSSYSSSERENGTYTCNAQFTSNDSTRLLKYMGSPLPGFEYKWPKEFK